MSGLLPEDNLTSWISELRARLDHGDLQTLLPTDLGHGIHASRSMHAIRIMLADLDRFQDMTPGEVVDPVIVSRRTCLLADFRVLRFLLD